MTIIAARDMADALEGAVRKYVEAGIMLEDSYSAISAAAASLRQRKKSATWEYSISRGEPIKFSECSDKRTNEKFNPLIMVEKISVNTERNFPYVSWVTVLVLEYHDRNKECPRWHFDLGNTGQVGPRVHLQYGGHYHDNRALDATLKEPRWTTFPLDTLLLMEVVAANFFGDYWSDLLRDDRTLKGWVRTSEGLCYTPLANRLSTYLESLAGSSNATFLHSCWNDTWI